MVKDVTIVGMGPIGLFAMFQAGLLSLSVQAVDAQPIVGGQCQELYPNKNIYDIPGYRKIKAGDLISSLFDQASLFFDKGHDYSLSYRVDSIVNKDDLFFVYASDGRCVVSRTVILALGNGVFEYNKIPVLGIDQYENRQLFYSISDLEMFRGANVTLLGAGDTSIDWLLAMVGVVANINLVHRRSKFRCLPVNQDRVFQLAQESKINLYTPYQIHGFEESTSLEEKRIERIIIKNIQDNTIKTINTDYIFPFFGMVSHMKFVQDWGIKTNGDRIIVQPNECQTNVKGVFAVGDAVNYNNRHKLILTGFAEVTFACYKILEMLKNGTNFTHSTSMSHLFESQ
ncbi:MAG: pyridine nucleotide-disulfide oxidoreductase family protein [Candidatus Xenolissoclinum pacificiensis L6]|uniref:Ferredoxin--NADP reductase n=1 Tax=Candidatus Xenolissoclinum pacificiensis L6 TaxID=1401685 RepID=W2UZZ4_9RICK|nr:MAG: pyridine nucleotide-disulfide oxidoreductase family protein [Candidatus Xenolissoclinum pacificiensis L6]